MVILCCFRRMERSAVFTPARLPCVMSSWKKRNDDNRGDYVMNMFVDARIRLADRKPKQDHSPNPANSSDNVIHEIARILHSCSASHRGTKCPNNGYEARQDNRLATVALVEFVSPGKMPLLEEPGILAAKQAWTCLTANEVAQLIAGYGAQGDQ